MSSSEKPNADNVIHYIRPTARVGVAAKMAAESPKSNVPEITLPQNPLNKSIVKENVVEKHPTVEHLYERLDRGLKLNDDSKLNGDSNMNSMAIEGYVPRTGVKSKVTSDACAAGYNQKKVAFRMDTKLANVSSSNQNNPRSAKNVNTTASPISLADLLSRRQRFDAEFVENVDISFSCMSPEEYHTLQQQQGDEMSFTSTTSSSSDDKDEKYSGLSFVYQDDESSENCALNNNDTHVVTTKMSIGHSPFPEDDPSQDEDEGHILDFMGGTVDMESAKMDDCLAKDPPETRAFLMFWEALAGWVTPDATEAVNHFRKFPLNSSSVRSDEPVLESIQHDTSDIGSSRCGGLMAVVKLHLGKAIDEVGGNLDQKRVQERIALLLLRFDYTRQMVKWETRMWRAFVVLLVSIVRGMPPSLASVLPKSLKLINLMPEEYKYLAQSALLSFGSDG